MSDGSSSSDDDSDDDDEDAELARELDLIRREREERRIREAEDAERAAEAAAQAKIHSNPLLAPSSSSSAVPSSAPYAVSASAFDNSLAHGAGGLKRRWDDDVVFKNQAKGDIVRKPQKRFINDTIRSDFHRSFLTRFVQ